MKKMTLFLMACVAVTLLSCEKEVKVIEVVDPQEEVVVPEENVLEYHAGIGIPETKTDLYGTKNIHWKAGDKILAKVDGTYKSFILNEGAGTENATFTYSGSGSTLDGDAAAFYGYNIGETGGFSVTVTDATHVTLPDTYAWSDQGIQAPMMDADGTNGSGKFTLMGAVLKVDVENIPAAANKLVFTATGKNISGDYVVTASGELVLSEGSNSTITITFTAGEATTRTFFIPLPTGTYDVVCPVTIQNDETVLYTKNIKANGLDLSKGDLMYVPAITCPTIFYSGAHSFGADGNALEVGSGYSWSSIESGTKLRVYYSYDSNVAYHQLSVAGNISSEWTSLRDWSDIGEAAYYECSDARLSDLDHSLQLNGKGLIISMVQLIRPNGAEMVIWNGNADLHSVSEVSGLQDPAFWASVDRYSTLTVYFTETAQNYDTWWTTFYIQDSSYKSIDGLSYGQNYDGSTHKSFTLTTEQKTALKTGGFILKGDCLIIHKITLK